VSGWCWFAWLDAAPAGALAAAAARDAITGEPAGVLVAIARGRRPPAGRLRMDAAIVDAEGAPAEVSLVLPPAGFDWLFDDPAVAQARRDVLAGRPVDAVTTFVSDPSHWRGSLTVARGPRRGALDDDPFARLWPARRLEVEAGLFGAVAMPPGPALERYAGKPWPAAGF
jgi:hypothetical protein